MQHRHSVIFLMALESHGQKLSSCFQPNAPQQDYPLDLAPHAMKIKRSQSLHSHDQTCPVDVAMSNLLVEPKNEGKQLSRSLH